MDTVPSDGHGWPVELSNEVLECDAAKYSMNDCKVLLQVRLRQQKSDIDELKPVPTHGETEMPPIRPLELRIRSH